MRLPRITHRVDQDLAAEAVARYSRWLDQLLEVALIGEEAAEFCRDVARSLD